MIYVNLGVAYVGLGKKTEAIQSFEKCIELSQDPELTQAARQKLKELQGQGHIYYNFPK